MGIIFVGIEFQYETLCRVYRFGLLSVVTQKLVSNWGLFPVAGKVRN